jgi:hypothetical protein
MRIRLSILAAWFVAAATAALAQEPGSRPGWTFTPGFSVEETYDDNISMFVVTTPEDVNNDFLTRYAPSADLHYSGKHTSFDSGYSGAFLAYRTFAELNQWDQHGHVSIKRQESARLEWLAGAMAATVPTTDLVDLAGIPFRRVGTSVANANASIKYRLNARNTLNGSTVLQRVEFNQPRVPSAFLRGGRAFSAFGGWRNHVSERLGLGVDYGLRRSVAIENTVPFVIHSIQGAADYAASPTWDISASGGIVFLSQNALTPGSTGPAWRLAADHHRANMTFSAWYLQTYVPSFGLGGGTVRSHEVGAGFHSPLFHKRHLYTDESLHFRDDTPLTVVFGQLPLRSLRIRSAVGWAPNPWLRVEGFYTRVQQTTLIAGGQMYRNLLGVQIVTSRPMRID